MQSQAPSVEALLTQLRERADEDAGGTAVNHQPDRHRLDLPELGLRVSLTRARYPNRAGGEDQYAVTLSRIAMDRAPDGPDVEAVLVGAFGQTASRAVEREAGQRVRMFRVPAS